ncbi:MAG: Gfo/Idh/MocA family oxidoreductase [Rikenellaceae bacterium]|nr:Gfo/Idh/MocA family oxidoreductase [Rikenellaceae bacterium]
MRKLKAVVIGTGLIGKQHAESIMRTPYVELAAISDPVHNLLEKEAGRLGVEGFECYREMIDKVRPDVVHNCTPNNLHFEINKYVLERGIHLYSEKPLAVTIEEGEELVRLAREKGVANGVNFNYRHNATVQQMRCLFQSGEAGRPLLIHGRYIQDWLLYPEDFNWRVVAGEGGHSRALADIGSHWFDTVQAVTGKKIAAVHADNFTVHPERGTGHRVDTEDGSVVVMKFDDGTVGNLVVSQVSAGYKNNFDISLDCQKYSLRWNQEQSDRLRIGTREEGVREIYTGEEFLANSIKRYATIPSGHPVGWADAMTNAVREFYASIQDGSYTCPQNLSYSDFANAVDIMKIVEACMESSRSGEWVGV